MRLLDSLNVKKQCQSYALGLWQCPRFLFLIMGGFIILAILITYTISQRYVDEPEIIALIILIISAVLFIIGHVIIAAFEKVAEASRAKSEFVSIMSHQLRTPLSAIKWQLNLLNDKQAPIDSPEARNFFLQFEEMNQKMIHIVNDLLELNRIEDKTLYLAPSGFSLKDVIAEAVERRLKALKETDIPVEIKEPENLPLVFADKIRMQSVVSHLLDNAIRYSGQNSQTPGKITITLEALPKFIRCSIKDQGIGISKEDAKRIFSKFFRAENALRYKTEGLGIRLYLAKSIVEATGGKIGFESKEGQGSMFWFTVPIAFPKS